MEQVLINKSTLTDIGNAIREKESSNELIPVLDMADRIMALGGASGKKIRTGTVIFATTATTQTIYHNCGFIPTYFDFRIKGTLPEAGTDVDIGCVLSGSFSQANGLEWSNSSGWVKFYSSPYNYRRVNIDQITNVNANVSITDTYISLTRASHNNYKYYAGYEYEWIAIE